MKLLKLLLLLSISLLVSCDKEQDSLDLPTDCYYMTVVRIDRNITVPVENKTTFRVGCETNLDSFKIQIGCNRSHINCFCHINQ